ncbi:MAG: FAD-binding oxidoreductase [Rhodospirillales bacterium]
MSFSLPENDQRGLDQSLWLATAALAPDCPPLVGDARCDVLVVGGGFTGLSTALHLSELGVDVALLEAMEPGFGASGRNGGQVINGLKDGLTGLEERFGAKRVERLHAFADRTADTVFGLIERYGIDCDARRDGWLQCAHSADAARRMAAKAERRAAQGGDVAYLDAAETARATGSEWYMGAFLDRRGGQLQPLSYARGLTRAALGLGARVHGRSPVENLERIAGRWVARTASGSVSADRVVLCTNGYSDLADLVPDVTRTVVPFFSYQVATRPISDNLRRSVLPDGYCVSDTRRLLGYCRFDAHGHFLMGARGYIGGQLVDDAFGLARSRIRQLYPQLADEPLIHFWNGRVAMTPDYFPRLMQPAPGLHAAMGWNGRGVAMTSAMGRVIADWLTGTGDDQLPMPVSPVRPIPLHWLRLVGAWAMAKAMDFRDRLERRQV